MSWISLDFKCRDCEVIVAELVDSNCRDEPLLCPECGGEMRRTISPPHVNTRTSRTFVDSVASGRFDKEREIQKLNKERSKIEKRGILATEVREEIKKIKASGKK